MKTIDFDTLRKIIKEELLSEAKKEPGVVSARDVVNATSDLLEALEEFETAMADANAVMNATHPHLGELKTKLEDMVNSPGSYFSKPKSEPRTVSLRAVKEPADK